MLSTLLTVDMHQDVPHRMLHPFHKAFPKLSRNRTTQTAATNIKFEKELFACLILMFCHGTNKKIEIDSVTNPSFYKQILLMISMMASM